MDDSDLDVVFDLMGSMIKSGSGTNRSAKCPLAPWTHPKGVDNNPSMTVKAGSPAVYRCWSCHEQGTIRALAKKYRDNSGDGRAYDYVCGKEGKFKTADKIKKRVYGEEKKLIAKRIEKEFRQLPLNDSDLKSKYLSRFPTYAIDRGLTREQIMKWEIGFDPKENRMIIPVRDWNKKLFGVSGRDLTDMLPNKYKHYHGLQKEQLLYGESFLNRSNKRAYIVEGFFDVWRLERLGLVNVLSPMGSSLSDPQVEKLNRWFKEVVFVPDFDPPGMRFVDMYADIILKKCINVEKVGIAGVVENTKFRKRIRPRDWEESDYRFKAISELDGRDPDDLKYEEIKLALNSIKRVTLL